MNYSKDNEMVLYSFSVEPIHDRVTLERYIEKHPDLAEDLIDLAFELRCAEAESHDTNQAQPTPNLGAAQQAWKQLIGSDSAKATAPARSGTLMSRLRGRAFVALADRLKFPRPILIAFRDRQVEPDSIPERIIARFAEATESTVQAVRDYLSSPPLIIQTAQFKTDNIPARQGRVTFEELVENTPMTDEERKVLLGDFADGHNRS